MFYSIIIRINLIKEIQNVKIKRKILMKYLRTNCGVGIGLVWSENKNGTACSPFPIDIRTVSFYLVNQMR